MKGLEGVKIVEGVKGGVDGDDADWLDGKGERGYVSEDSTEY